MKPGLCKGGKKDSNCRFRQPGTWVVECEEFEERPVLVPTGLVLPGLAAPEQQRADQSGA